MIKKILLIIILFSCNNNSNEQIEYENSTNVINEIIETTSETTTEEYSTFNDISTSDEVHINLDKTNIIGKWKVTELALISIWADGKTKEEYEKNFGLDEEIFLGTEIEFNDSYIKINNEKFNFPKYWFNETDIDEFNDNIRFETTFNGIPQKIAVKNLYDLIEERKYPINYHLPELYISVKENIHPPFFHCIILDKDTMLTYSTKALLLKRIH